MSSVSRRWRRSPNSLYGGASRVLRFAGREVGVESAQVTGEYRPSAVHWPGRGRPKRWAWPITCQMLEHATAEAGHLSGGAGASVGDQIWSGVGTTAGGVAGLARAPSMVLGQFPTAWRAFKWGSMEKRGRARAAGHRVGMAGAHAMGQQVVTAGTRARQSVRCTGVGGHEVGAQVPQGKGQGTPLVKRS